MYIGKYIKFVFKVYTNYMKLIFHVYSWFIKPTKIIIFEIN
jgi:hypothetical protein